MPGIEIPFSFPQDGSVTELRNALRQLNDESKTLSETFANIPLDELRLKFQQQISILSQIQLETQRLSQSDKAHQNLLNKSATSVNNLIDQLNKYIEVQKLVEKSENSRQNGIDRLNKESLKALNGQQDLNKVLAESGRLTEAQARQLSNYGDTIKKNADILTILNSRLKDGIAVQEESLEQTKLVIGHMNQLQELILNLNTEYKELSESELKNSEVTKYYSETIGKLSGEMLKYQIQITDTIALEKAQILLSETDLDIKAKTIIANNELNAAISQRVKILSGSYAKEIEAQSEKEQIELANYTKKINLENELAYEQYLKEKELADKKIANNEAALAKQTRLTELAYAKMWISAEKSYGKTWNAAEKCYIESEAIATKSGKAAVWSLENIGNTAERMGLRTLISFTYWTILIGGATELYEILSKVDNVTQQTLDRLKDYFDSFKAFQKSLIESEPRNSATTQIEVEKAGRLIKEIQDQSNTPNQRYNKYKELQSDYGKVFDKVDSKEDFAKLEQSDRFKEQIKTMNELISIKQNIIEQTRIGTEATTEENLKIQEQTNQENKIVAALKERIKANSDMDDNDKMFYNRPEAMKQIRGMSNEQLLKYGLGLTSNTDETRSRDMSDIENEVRIYNNLHKQIQTNIDQSVDSAIELDKLEHRKTQIEGNEADKKQKKLPKGKNKLTEDLKNQEDDSKIRSLELQKSYDANNPYNTYDDDDNLSRSKIAESQANLDAKLKIIEKYHHSIYEDEGEYTDHKKKAAIEQMEIDIRQNENENRIFIERRKRYEEALAQHDHFVEEMSKMNEKLLQLQTKGNYDKIQQSKDLDEAGVADAFYATTGTEDTNRSFKNQQERLQNQINAKNDEIENAKNQLIKYREQADSSRKWLDLNGGGSREQDAEAARNSGQFRLQLSQNEDANKNAGITSSSIESLTQERDKTASEKAISLAARKAQAIKDIERQSFEFGVKLINDQYQLQKERVQQQIQDSQSRYSLETQLAGNNSNAKQRIALEEHRNILALKRKEAEIEKTQGILSAFISTYEGVAKAIGSAPPPYNLILAGITLAAGLETVDKIQAQPLPQYAKGKKKGEGRTGLALINEEGPEAIKRNGVHYILGGGQPTIAHIEKQDEILPNKFLKDLLKGTGVVTQHEKNQDAKRFQAIQSGITKKDFQEALREEIKNMPAPQLIIPADHVIKNYQDQRKRNGLAD